MSILPDPLHPAVVHFPLALTFTALLFEALAKVPRWRSLDSGAALLISLAALGCVAGLVTGRLAEAEAVVPLQARDLLEQHDTLGVVATVAVSLLAGARLVLVRGARQRGPLGWVYLVILTLVALLMGYQGHLGGRLVFDHGVGTPQVLSVSNREVPARGISNYF